MKPVRALVACLAVLVVTAFGHAAAAAPTRFSAAVSFELDPRHPTFPPIYANSVVGVADVQASGAFQIPKGLTLAADVDLTLSSIAFPWSPFARLVVAGGGQAGANFPSTSLGQLNLQANGNVLIGVGGCFSPGGYVARTPSGELDCVGLFPVPISPIGATPMGPQSAMGSTGFGLALTVSRRGQWGLGVQDATSTSPAAPCTGMSPVCHSFRGGFDARTAGHLGSMQFVAPFHVATSLSGSMQSIAGWATLLLTFDAAHCGNGQDDDNDALVDAADPGCRNAADLSELADCSDGIDDDADGYADASDPGCQNGNTSGSREDPQCDNGLDDDNDGKIDWDGGPSSGTPDPQCVGSPGKDKEKKKVCGLGFELALALAVLRRLARRKES